MIKKTLLGILITASFLANSSESKINCTVGELNKNQEHFCLIKEDKKFYIKEVLNIHENDDVYNQYQRIQKINNISEELFNKKIQFKNENGLGVILTENGDFYTTRIGYELKNGHYLEIKNNIIEDFKLEEVRNVKKFISKYNLYALDKNNQLWRKVDSKWSKIDIKNVYDFVYNDEGLIYILSESGIYYGSDTGKLSDLKLMEIYIKEDVYKDKMTKEKYTEYVEKSIFNDKTKLKDFINETYEYKVYIDNEELKNKDFYERIEDNKIIIYKENEGYGYDQEIIHYRNPVQSKRVLFFNFNDEYLSLIKTKYSFRYNTYFVALEENTIKTKYNNNIFFANKEYVIVESGKYLENSVSRFEIRATIIVAFENGNYVFNLRDNGMLTITDIKTGISKYIYNVNDIRNGYNVKILIDPTFENYSAINKFDALNIEDIDEEKAFVFKFKDFKSLEHENIKEKIRAIEPR